MSGRTTRSRTPRPATAAAPVAAQDDAAQPAAAQPAVTEPPSGEPRSVEHVTEPVGSELTVSTAAAVGPLVLAQARTGTVDVTGLDEIDTAGLQVLLLARRIAGAAGYDLMLRGAGTAVLDVLELAGVAAQFATEA